MKAISITQIEDTLIESIMQDLSEEIEIAGSEVQKALLCGCIISATETIRELATSLEDLVWDSYLKTVFECKRLLVYLRQLVDKKDFVLSHTRI